MLIIKQIDNVAILYAILAFYLSFLLNKKGYFWLYIAVQNCTVTKSMVKFCRVFHFFAKLTGCKCCQHMYIYLYNIYSAAYYILLYVHMYVCLYLQILYNFCLFALYALWLFSADKLSKIAVVYSYCIIAYQWK